MLDIIIMY